MIEGEYVNGIVDMFDDDQHEASVQSAIDRCVSDITATIYRTINKHFSKGTWRMPSK